MRILLQSTGISFEAVLSDTVTAKEIYKQLPVESIVSRWGDELYFSLPFKASAEGATMDVAVGDIAYWSQGKALCVFFGLTPASTANIPEPASPVVLIGKTSARPETLRQIQGGETITVARIE